MGLKVAWLTTPPAKFRPQTQETGCGPPKWLQGLPVRTQDGKQEARSLDTGSGGPEQAALLDLLLPPPQLSALPVVTQHTRPPSTFLH